MKAKARAAEDFCRHATSHEKEHGGKPSTYVLIPAMASMLHRAWRAWSRDGGEEARWQPR